MLQNVRSLRLHCLVTTIEGIRHLTSFMSVTLLHRQWRALQEEHQRMWPSVVPASRVASRACCGPTHACLWPQCLSPMCKSGEYCAILQAATIACISHISTSRQLSKGY